jgi:hypothetical protein
VNGELVLRLLITNVHVDRPAIDRFLATVAVTGRELLTERGLCAEPGAGCGP